MLPRIQRLPRTVWCQPQAGASSPGSWKRCGRPCSIQILPCIPSQAISWLAGMHSQLT